MSNTSSTSVGQKLAVQKLTGQKLTEKVVSPTLAPAGGRQLISSWVLMSRQPQTGTSEQLTIRQTEMESVRQGDETEMESVRQGGETEMECYTGR